MLSSVRLHLAGALLTFAATSLAAPLELQVVAAARLHARATPLAEGGFVVRGVLTDDRGAPLVQQPVRARATDGSGTFRACPEDGRDSRFGTRPTLETDSAGRFCLRWEAPAAAPNLAFLVEFPGTVHYEGTSARANVETSRENVELRFAPLPDELALDAVVHTVRVETALNADATEQLPAEPVRLELVLEEPTGSSSVVLATTTVRAGEPCRFEFDGTKLRRAGLASLVARTQGTLTLAPAQTRATVLRTARVTLGLPHATQGSHQYELPLTVGATAAGNQIPTGAISLELPGMPAITKPLVKGTASLEPPQRHHYDGEVPARVRYLPDNSAWQAGAPLDVRLLVTPPSRWRHVPWGVAAAAVLAWLALSWRRPSAFRGALPSQGLPGPSGVAALHHVVQDSRPSGWRGVVVDAHEGSPVLGAVITVIAPRLDGSSATFRANAASDGTFALEHTPLPEGARFTVEAPQYARFERAAPPPGTVRISLVTRRRQILESFVAWTRHRTGWLRLHHEATPRDVRLRAEALDSPSLRDWAAEVEDAAFGPALPTESAARRVGELERRVERPLGPPSNPPAASKTAHQPFQR